MIESFSLIPRKGPLPKYNGDPTEAKDLKIAERRQASPEMKDFLWRKTVIEGMPRREAVRLWNELKNEAAKAAQAGRQAEQAKRKRAYKAEQRRKHKINAHRKRRAMIDCDLSKEPRRKAKRKAKRVLRRRFEEEQACLREQRHLFYEAMEKHPEEFKAVQQRLQARLRWKQTAHPEIPLPELERRVGAWSEAVEIMRGPWRNLPQ